MSLYYCVFGRAAAGITINREARGRGSGCGAGGGQRGGTPTPAPCSLLPARGSPGSAHGNWGRCWAVQEGDFGERPPRSGDAAAGPSLGWARGHCWSWAVVGASSPASLCPPHPCPPCLPRAAHTAPSARVLPRCPLPSSSSSLGAVQLPLTHLSPFPAQPLKLGSWRRWELL